jgi:hypothetical protein
MAAWTTAAKTNFDRISRLQNQALRIITGGMRSTPISALEKNHDSPAYDGNKIHENASPS